MNDHLTRLGKYVVIDEDLGTCPEKFEPSGSFK